MSNAARSGPPLNRLIVVGASAGGVPALLQLTAGLPAALPAAVLVVLHVGAHRSMLPVLMDGRSPLDVAHARHGEALVAGTVRVAPPDHHVLVADGHLYLTRGPKVHHSRPAIDPLFRSAALAYGAQTVGVVLTGMLDDGTAGLQAVKSCGGVAVVQDPLDATEPSMPASALRHVAVDHCLPLAGMPALLTRLAQAPVAGGPPADQAALKHEQALLLAEGDAMDHLRAIAEPTAFACPDCHGGLWEMRDSLPPQYRCHTGHGFSERSLQHALATAGDEAGWNALRAVQERRIFLQHIADKRRQRGEPEALTALDEAIATLERQAALLRDVLEGGAGPLE